MNRLIRKISVMKSCLLICGLTLLISILLLPPVGISGASDAIKKNSLVINALPKKGDQITLRQHIPLFSERVFSQDDLHELYVAQYNQQVKKLMVTSTNAEMLSVHTYEFGTLWVPLWYLSEASEQMEDIAPQYLSLNKQAQIKLTPTSTLKWQVHASTTESKYESMSENTSERMSESKYENMSESASEPPSASKPESTSESFTGDRFVAIAKWKEWYGVIVIPAIRHNEYSINYPVLLWVKDKDVERTESIPAALLAANSTVKIDDVWGITDILLQRTDQPVSSEDVLQLLGEPVARETSVNLQNLDGGPMILGETWRYERADAQFIITFSKEGQLKRTKWILPGEGNPMTFYSGDNYEHSKDFTVAPLASTLPIKSEWHNQGDLNYSYLIGANKKVLVIKGDDGGYSGMHHDSSLYGVDRENGDKLWQIDAGFGGLTAYMDPSGNYVTVATAYNPQAKQYENRAQRIRLSDGKVIWELKPDGKNGFGMLAAQGTIILWDQTGLYESGQTSATVLDSETGRSKWKMTLDKDARVINQGVNDLYVLIRDNKQLRAYDPDTGKESWNIESQGAVLNDPNEHSYYAGGPRIEPFKEQGSQRWIMLGSQWLLLDIKTGKSLAEYPASSREQFEVLDSKQRYLLVQRSLDAEEYWGAYQYETILYDSFEKRALWRIDGKGSKGIIEEGNLYLVVNGVPTAVEFNTGHLLWRMPTTASVDTDLSNFAAGSYIILDKELLYPFGSDLLVIRKKDGSVRGRIQNMAMGYADLRELLTRNGTLNVSGNELYAGSANGGFTRFSITEIEKWLEQS